jgi:hypothetical protein
MFAVINRSSVVVLSVDKAWQQELLHSKGLPKLNGDGGIQGVRNQGDSLAETMEVARLLLWAAELKQYAVTCWGLWLWSIIHT